MCQKKFNHLVCRGPNFSQGKYSKEFSITCWIWQANAILINLISIWSDSKLWLKRESDSSFLFENSNHVSNCKFDPLSNCSQLKFWLISIRNRIDQKQIKHVILNSFKYFWDKIWTPAYIKIIKILIYWLHITSIRIPHRRLPGFGTCHATDLIQNFFIGRTLTAGTIRHDGLFKQIAHREYFLDSIGKLRIAVW